MESQGKEEEYKHSVWEIYRKEWETANSEKRVELNKRMLRWQELIKNGWTASQAYIRVMQGESDYGVVEQHSDNPPSHSFWAKMGKAPYVILAVALVAAIVYCVVITREIDTLKTELDSVQGELEKAEAELELYEETLGVEVFSGIPPPYEKERLGWSLEINLNNNPIASNPTWQELIAFLLADTTDDETYWKSTFNCTNFAEMLHNNAEAAGIKSAFVAMFFEGEEVGHALNAFKTTNKGLVYVDCTGGTLEERLNNWRYQIEYDKIAYVVKGNEYGMVSIDMAVSPEYSFYEQIDKSSRGIWETLDIVESIKIYW